MRICPPERLADTTSISDCKRFVAGFQSVSNISATGQRRHLLGVRISYLLLATYVPPEAPPEGGAMVEPKEMLKFSAHATIPLVDILDMIHISHKAFGDQWCSDECATDLYYMNQVLGLTSPALNPQHFPIPTAEAPVVQIPISIILPWAPSMYGDSCYGEDPLDGCADLGMFLAQGEVITSLVFDQPSEESGLNYEYSLYEHAIDLDIVETADLYVFQPQEFRTTRTNTDPTELGGSYRKQQVLLVASDAGMQNVPSILSKTVNYTVDGRPVYDSLPASTLLSTLYNTAGDLRFVASLFQALDYFSSSGQFPTNGRYLRPAFFPIVNRNHTRAMAQLGPAGSVFKIKGATGLVTVTPPEKPRFIEYSWTVRDYAQFAVQVARAGLDPVKFPNSKIKAGSKLYSEVNAAGDEAIGLGLRWPNVNEAVR